ncbi:MAG: hydroxyacid dehydrogenase [Anaerolineae bacterium]
MKILVSDPIAREGLDLLRQQAQVDVWTKLSPDELLTIIGGYDALIVRSRTKVTAEVIEAGERLRVIGRAGVGLDNIDLKAAQRRGITVVNSPDPVSAAVAEHTIALMLALARHIPQADASLRRREWLKTQFRGVGVEGKTLGVIGLGRIGAAVAQRAQGLGMEVIAHDPYLSAGQIRERGATPASLEELLEKADFVTVHVPLTRETQGLIGARQFSMMKPTARLINCARGGMVDEEALVSALEEGRLAGAAFDVFEKEPPLDSPLLANDKVVLTPHLGSSTVEAQSGVAVAIAQKVLVALQEEG